jgi:signal transduction histidine kinase
MNLPLTAIDPIVFVYFIYGLAFFTMGLALTFETTRHPADSIMRRAMVGLTFFSIVHGAHEWFEMFLQIEQTAYGRHATLVVEVVRLAVLIISFGALSMSGCALLCKRPKGRMGWVFPAIVAVYLAGLIFIVPDFMGSWDVLLHVVDAWTRYSMGVAGAIAAGLGLILHGRDQETINARAQHGLYIAGGALIAYGVVGQTVPAPSALFPSTVYNTETFQVLFGFPVQLLRAGMAAIATGGLMIALREAEVERYRALEAANAARLAAEAQARDAIARREALQKELLRRTVAAQEAERARIARELHDQTGQMLTALTYHIAALGNGKPIDPKTVDDLAQLADQALTELRHIVVDLRPAQLDDLGLVAALHWLVDETRRRLPLDVQIAIEGRKTRLPDDVETALFRIAQEALTNVARHAGVDRARLELAFERGRVRMMVRDEGRGFAPQAVLLTETAAEPAWGLIGMQERADAAGGRLDIIAAQDKGVTVCVTIPLSGENDHDRERTDPAAAGGRSRRSPVRDKGVARSAT